MNKKFTLIIALLLCANFMMAQGLTVTGKITSAEDEVLPFANILVKGTQTATTSDIEGNYSITMPEGTNTLVFSFTGYKSQEIEVNGQTVINVTLTSGINIEDEVIVVGYTIKKKKEVTGAVSQVDMEEVGKIPYATVTQALQGRIAGVTGTQDGQPGAGRNSLRVRGLTTFGNGAQPLIVIDGIPTTESIANLNPNDIAEISVLKDASAAIYGVNGGAGVILITTKKGSKGKKISVDAGVLTGIQQIGRRIPLLNATEWGEVYWEAFQNFNPTGSPQHPQYGNGPTPVINTVPFLIENGRQVYQYTLEGTDWYDAVYRNNAFQQQYYANISSGTDRGSVMFGMSYNDQDGLIDFTNYNRITARLNSRFKFTDWLTIGENVNVAYSDQVQTGTQQGQDGMPTDVIRQHPLLPVLAFPDFGPPYAGKIDGLPDVRNMVSVLDKNQNNNTEGWNVFANVYAEANILDAFDATRKNHDLLLRTSGGLEYGNFFGRQFNAAFQEGDFDVQGNSLTTVYGKAISTTFQNTLQYRYTNDIMNVSLLTGMEAREKDYTFFQASQTNFEIETVAFTHIGAGSGDIVGNGGGESWGLMSYFSRADFSFFDKYQGFVMARRDATSRFNAVGLFPAASLGWVVTNEEFFKNILGEKGQGILSSLKLRTSWGQTGNQDAAGVNAALSFLGPDKNHADYDLFGTNSGIEQGYATLFLGNPNLQWETTTQTNIGADINLLDYRLNVTFDYYIKESSDIIRSVPQIAAVGEGSPPFVNAATMRNTGIELGVGYQYYNKNNDLSFNANLQFATINNVVTSLGGTLNASVGNDGELYTSGFDGPTRIAEGYAFGAFYGHVVEGIFQDEAEAAAHPDQTGRGNKVGRLKYADLNGDNIINDLDRTYLGSPLPNYTMGLNLEVDYKNFTLTAFLYSAIGQKVYNENKWYTDFAQSGFFNHSTRVLDAWSPSNTASSIPMVTIDDEGNNEARASSYFVEDASFLKLRTARLAYEFPKKWTKNYAVNVYAEAQNLLTITNYTGADPEVPFAANSNTIGLDRGAYPIPRTFLFGLNVKL